MRLFGDGSGVHVGQEVCGATDDDGIGQESQRETDVGEHVLRVVFGPFSRCPARNVSSTEGCRRNKTVGFSGGVEVNREARQEPYTLGPLGFLLRVTFSNLQEKLLQFFRI